MKVLIVEDDTTLAQEICSFLREERYTCDQAASCAEAHEKIDLYEYDCVVLDLMLPDGDGLDILKEINQKNNNTGVIILSAKGSLEDKITGLTLGADDYLPKPFHLSELKIRLHAIYRRRRQSNNNITVSNHIHINTLLKTACVKEVQLQLTKSEWSILYYFVNNKDRVISKQALAEYLCGDMTDFIDNFNFVYTHVKNLKGKLKDAGACDCIKNVYGLGYKWVEE